jgi:biopolymer transport protein ExbD
MLTKKKKRRAASGLIIRLIDVVLILLFGFIAISEISKKSKIDLPESEAVPATAPDREVVVYIGILPDGRYLVEEETAVIDDSASLMRYILQKQSELNSRNIRMRVRVRANYDSEVRYAFTVVNICQDTKIPVGLDVIKKGR